ncbi:PAS domain S-box protein [Sphingorhabdus soli]|uniref:histidine kinase n=1 Tax=Flavisphingopyxis soli TaxID=2601267 RepID=A0A5C6UBP9_9SPHN|nr:HWE histidine kinase domain-containing protein [Sphingorhabdus soli]TXC69268.1 PAS domain S-box protein [Sphingorhabdus soli]
MTLAPSFEIDPALAPILATVLDAVVVMTPEGLIGGWNECAEKIFGWSALEARGQVLADLIVPEQFREAHNQGLNRLAQGGTPQVLHRRIEITALRRDGHEFPIELSITEAQSSSGPAFIGFIRDISERRDAEAQIERQAFESRLMFEIANMASNSDSFESALRKALEAICQITGWPVGHAFVVPPGNPQLLSSSGIWVETETGLTDALREKTIATQFRSGVGLPGRILATGEPLWLTDTDTESNFPRKGSGFRGAFGFPLKQDGRVIAVLEFFSKAQSAPVPEILLTVRAIGEQVGRVFERKRTQDHQNLLLHELDHRVKNILSVVQAIAQQTFRRASSVEDAYGIFRGRLMAVAQAQDILVSQNVEGATLREIIDGALEGSGVSADRVTMDGPEVRVSGRNAVTISLAIHELCTNAFKYGALSVDDGSVTITWGIDDGQAKSFQFEWREQDGPPVVIPDRKGFGTSLLERGLAAELGGQIILSYAPEGVICSFTAPLQ